MVPSFCRDLSVPKTTPVAGSRPILALAATTIVSTEALAERDRGTWASSRHIWDVMTGKQNADQRGGHGKESEMAQRRRYLGPASGNRGASQHHYAKDEGPANRPAADEPAKEGPVAVPGRRRHEMTAYRIDGSGNLRVLHPHSLPSLGTIAT